MRLECIICAKKDGRKSGINCNECGLYYHKICLNLPIDQFKFLVEANEFTCQACKNLDLNYVYKPTPVSKDCLACLKTQNKSNYFM
jgi:hypothetical protein